jgi:hypothetical protein
VFRSWPSKNPGKFWKQRVHLISQLLPNTQSNNVTH